MKELLESAEQLCRTVESQFEEIHTPKQVVLRDAVLRDIYRLRDAIKDASNSQYAKAVNEEKAPSTERFNADNVEIFSVFQRTIMFAFQEFINKSVAAYNPATEAARTEWTGRLSGEYNTADENHNFREVDGADPIKADPLSRPSWSGSLIASEPLEPSIYTDKVLDKGRADA